MERIDIDTLFKTDKKDLNKIPKDQLVESILKNAWYWQNKNEHIEKLQRELALSKAPYNQAKQMLIGATGFDAPVDEYSKKVDLDSVDLCFLIGLLLSKGAK